MKHKITLYFIIFLSLSSYSQKLITFVNEKTEIKNRRFYITVIYDERENKEYIGEIRNELLANSEKIDIEGGTLQTIGDFLKRNFSKTSDKQIPVIVSIQKIEITQTKNNNTQKATAFVSIKFEPQKGIVAIKETLISEETNDAFSTHGKRIKKAVLLCAEKYNSLIKETTPELKESENISPYERENNYNNNEEEDAIEITFDNNKDWNKKEKKKTKNIGNYNEYELRDVKTVGFLIGGMTILGFDYEKRIHKNFGIHAGAGIFGYTGGVKYHLNSKPSSLFVNLSWKDAGFGLINGFGLEAGSRWIWSKKRNFGLYFQGGIFILNHIDEEFKKTQYTDKNIELLPVTLSYGIGLSW